ncbi:MAG TPA: SDR family NAD(P)-dependent oxidoreductase [Gemmatimonadales bacterium]|nr:SDR family NAD(P)-dependent oxidoreductase [Gemmatimonadales bacterium]
MPEQRVVLITGASSGVGQATARLLAQRGYRVLGTSRKPAAAGDSSGVTMVPLDVRSDDSVAACLSAVAGLADRLDILVNNAGYEQAGAVEEHSMEEAKAQFETNFFGVVRMVKAVLPLMRRQRHGQIINVTSLAGLSPIPFMGIYSASKFALEGYTEALRLEVKPFNIRVSQIEVGFLRTPMMDRRQVTVERIAEYDPWRQRAFDAIRAAEEGGPGPELVAGAVLEIAASSTPRLRYVIGKQARFVTRLRRFLPEGAFEQGVRSTFRLDRKG